MSNKKLLTKKIANLFLFDNSRVLLGEFTAIEDEAAEILSQHHGFIDLSGLTGLSDAAAESLSNHLYWLDLSGLTYLSDIAAESLGKHRGEKLFLNGIKTLSASSAKSLSSHGGIQFGQLTNLSDTAAAYLVDQCDLLSGLMGLSDAAAEILSQHHGFIDLSGLTGLSDAAAESLSKHQGGLCLDGLSTLSDEAAESLSKYQGMLSLSGLQVLSDSTAESLSKHQFELDLSGLRHLSDTVSESLSKHQGRLFLGGLQVLSDSAAESFSKHNYELDLPGLLHLSDAAAESLSKKKGGIGFACLESLSDKVAKLLVEHSCTDRYYGHVKGSGIYLTQLLEIRDSAAEILSNYRGNIILKGIKSISDASADSLSKLQGDLSLPGLTSLSDNSAACLSKHQGELDLSGLTSLSDVAAESLGRHQGNLNLSGLTSLPEELAQVIVKRSFLRYEDTLNLVNIRSLSDAAAESLSYFQGKCLVLSGLIDVSNAAVESLCKNQRRVHFSKELKDRVPKAILSVESKEADSKTIFPSHDGFTILILVIFIGIAVLPKLFFLGSKGVPTIQEISPQQIETDTQAVKLILSAAEAACEQYKMDTGEYPIAFRDLFERPSGILASEWRGPYLPSAIPPRDHWGNEFHYRHDGDNVYIWSAGPDGDVSTTDDNLGKVPDGQP